MSYLGPIVFLDHNQEDSHHFEEIISQLGFPNRVIHFMTAKDTLDFLCSTDEKIFIIFCDTVLRDSTGLAFKETIDCTPELRKKSIPFIFYTQHASPDDVNNAFMRMSVQGFFKKPQQYNEYKQQMHTVLSYWKNCKHPNTQ